MPGYINRLPEKARRLIAYWNGLTEDGGPGSGNWGHKGRPGLVGGSGKGGGKQYRGGRGDVRYVGSKADWLNGLKGETQKSAQNYLKEISKLHGNGENDKRTPEKMIMEMTGAGAEKSKKKLLDFMAEARSWPETSRSLTDENWDEADKKIASVLATKYGVLSGHNELPDDTNTTGWNEDDLNYWYDLKSKAMGGPTSGQEAPDELQYDAGLKERPAPPKPTGPDMSWYENRDLQLGPYLSAAMGENNFGRHTKDEFLDLNQRFLDKCKYGQLGIKEAKYAYTAIRKLRKSIYPATVWGDSSYDYTPDSYKNLSDDEKNRLVEIVQAFCHGQPAVSNVNEIDNTVIKALENSIYLAPLRSKQDRQMIQDYAIIQEKILGGFEQSTKDTIAAGKEKDKEAAKAKAAERQRKFESEQQEFKQSDRATKKKDAQAKIKALDVDALRKSPTTTRADVENAINDTGIFYGDKKFITDPAIPVESYLDAMEAYKRVVSQFPFLAGDLGGFGENYKKSNAAAGAITNAYKTASEIIINYNIFQDREKQNNTRKNQIILHHFKVPIDDNISAAQATVSHELGHVLSNWLHRVAYGAFPEALDKKTKRLYDDNLVANEIMEKTLKATKTPKKKIEEAVSGYGATDSREFFAECFCECMCSSNPRPVAREFMNQVQTFIADHGIMDMTSGSVESALYSFIPYKA